MGAGCLGRRWVLPLWASVGLVDVFLYFFKWEGMSKGEREEWRWKSDRQCVRTYVDCGGAFSVPLLGTSCFLCRDEPRKMSLNLYRHKRTTGNGVEQFSVKLRKMNRLTSCLSLSYCGPLPPPSCDLHSWWQHSYCPWTSVVLFVLFFFLINKMRIIACVEDLRISKMQKEGLVVWYAVAFACHGDIHYNTQFETHILIQQFVNLNMYLLYVSL